ncbi:MAG: hypothetical protein V2A64_05475 [Candidatus Omnitrophota bacterium]
MKDIRARSFVTIMVFIAFSTLVLRIAIEQIVKFNITQNESSAEASLKLISAALENYAKDNQGVFPTNLAVLAQTTPSYLDASYINQSPLKGYSYNCFKLEQTGYNCSAVPTKCRLTGNIIYTITTGGALVSEACK